MINTSPCYFTAREDGQYVVSYEITNTCNMNCQHCMNRSGKDAFSGMDSDAIKKLFKELYMAGIRYLYISGGEPLVHPEIDTVLEYAHDLGFQMMLATNGLEVEKHLDTIERCVGDVSISLDGIGETHDDFRGTPGAFENVMKAISLLRERGVYTRISTCLWRGNISQLEEIIELADTLGLGKVNLSILVPTGRALENEVQLEWCEYPDLIKRIDRLQEKYSGSGHIDVVLRRKSPLSSDSIDCIGGTSIFHINAHGRISPCSWCSKADTEDRFSIQWRPGNLGECIEKVKGISSLLTERKNRYGYTGCPAIALFQNGSFEAEDPINVMLGGNIDEIGK